MKPRTVVRLAALAAMLLLVVLLQVVKSIDLEHYRSQLAQLVLQQTGRELHFANPLMLKLGFRPALVTDGVSLANLPGRDPDEMIRLDHIEAEIGLLPLFSGQIRVNRLWIDGADIALQSEGRGNWQFSPPAEPTTPPAALPPGTMLHIAEVIIEHARVYYDAAPGGEPSLRFARVALDSDGPVSPIAVTLEGDWSGRRLSVNGVIGSLRELLKGAFPLQFKMLTPGMVVSVDGALQGDLPQGPSASLAIAFDVSDSADLNPWLGLNLPSLGSARAAMTLGGRLNRPRLSDLDVTIGRHDTLAIGLKGKIEDPVGGNGVDLALSADGDIAALLGAQNPAATLKLLVSGHFTTQNGGKEEERLWRISDLKASLGRSDLLGQLQIRRRPDQPVIEGQFESNAFDLALLSGQPIEPNRDSPATEPSIPADPRFFSDLPLPLSFLQTSEGRLTWHLLHVTDHHFDARNVALTLDWRRGRAQADGTIGQLAGGALELHAALDGAARPPSMSLDLALSHLTLGELLAGLGADPGISGGRVDFRLKAIGGGESPRAIFASLQGKSLLSLGPMTILSPPSGKIIGTVVSNLATDAGNGPADLRCLLSHFTLIDGLARSEALVFSLGSLSVTGQGSLNLTDESLDFTLTPRPNGQGAATPLNIGGTLLHPQIAANRGAIVRNLPAVTATNENALAGLVSDEGNPCYAAYLQGKKTRGAGR